jgi:hypothetical protein
MGWMGASMNPGSYGDMWKGFMNPATYTAPAANWTIPGFTAPAAGSAAPAGTFNFFDPNAWTQMMQVPGLTAPAAQGGYAFPFPMPTAPVAPAAAPVK